MKISLFNSYLFLPCTLLGALPFSAHGWTIVNPTIVSLPSPSLSEFPSVTSNPVGSLPYSNSLSTDSTNTLPNTSGNIPSDTSGNAPSPSSTSVSISIPGPFDSGYDYHLTPSCANFFQTFLSNPDFISCYSFGFLMIDSLGFSRLARNITNIPPLLDAICAATMNVTVAAKCAKVMSNYLTQMADSNNCGADLTANPVNPEAYQGFLSFFTYGVYQTVGCLRNSAGQYCYENELIGIYCSCSHFCFNIILASWQF